MHIVLDTNVLRRDFPLASPDMRLMREYLHKTGSDLFIPKVVLDELHNQHREVLEKTRSELLTSFRQALVWSNVKLPDIDVVAECQLYRKELEQHLTRSYRARIVNYPNISHERLVARDLERRKPFSESGRGYRDALIWYSVLSLLSSHQKDFAFVTSNVKDFWNTERTGLHPELLEDLVSEGIDQGRLRVFSGVESLNAVVAKPKLKMLGDVAVQLQQNAHPTLDLREVLGKRESELKAQFANENANSLIRQALGYLFLNLESGSLSTMDGPDAIKVTDVVEIEGKKLFVAFICHYELVFNGLIPIEDVRRWERSGVLVFEPEVLGDHAEIDFEFRGEFRIALVFDPGSDTVDNFEITEVELAPC